MGFLGVCVVFIWTFSIVCLGFIWNSISQSLEDFLQRKMGEALSWVRNYLLSSPAPVVPLPDFSIRENVGAEETLSEIRRLVVDDDKARIIGIYGMGGIGKTTLLRTINNELLDRGPGPFNLVIWVTVSEEPDVWKIQEDIAVRLGYSRRNQGQGQGQTLPEHPTDRVQSLLSALSKKKFLLLLDDLWNKLDLDKVGVPFSSLRKGSKMVFTTRSEKVCTDMDAHEKVKVPLLDPESSWELFCQKLGRRGDQWDTSVRSLAQAVCKKCGGLPLALITVAEAMAVATTPGEWEKALKGRKAMPTYLGDRQKDGLDRLKLSFDRLKDASARECLLYCALFPEGDNINIYELIDYWVGEGLLDEGRDSDSMDTARGQGLSIISSLKSACLLEEGEFKEMQVKLHDTVREMALWITSGKEDDNGNVFLVNTREGLTRVPTEATRISLIDNEISVLPENPQCHNLHTLLLSWNRPLKEIPVGFFQYMPRLRVLDLSETGISHLPLGIGSLVELRFLNLSDTCLESLPMELGRLTKLRQLCLERTWSLKSIPRRAISSLAGLQSLSMFASSYVLRRRWDEGGGDSEEGGDDLEEGGGNWEEGGRDSEEGGGDSEEGGGNWEEGGGNWEEGGRDSEEGANEGGQLCLTHLGGLKQLEELGVSIRGMTEEGMQALQQNFEGLCALIKSLCLSEVESESFDLSICLEILKGLRKLKIENSDHLEELILNTNQLSHCPQLEELDLFMLPLARISWTDGNLSERGPSIAAIFTYLMELSIGKCEALEDVTWIRDLPSIEIIVLKSCSKMEELIVVEEVMMGQNVADFENDSFFPKLKEIKLYYLPNLRSICRHPLLFPSLEHVAVSRCPELKKLPFGLPSAKNIKWIRGKQEWWDALEWDHEDIRSRFSPYFKPTRN